MHHSRGLRQLLSTSKQFSAEAAVDRLISHLQQDFRQAELELRDLAMLIFSAKLTVQPGEISSEDLQPLRDHGFDDLAIHDIVLCVSYFAFANRIADGLGIDLEKSTES